jgi:NAD(P)-dependent dehydrogenase (short-subunit alcohol dehydrogenase family)
MKVSDMPTRFTNKIALVTGGSTGIGLATAKLLIEEGAKVYITGRTQKTLDEAAAHLGSKAVPVLSDVASLADLKSLSNTVAKAGDKLDHLFANAGVAEYNTLGQTDEAEYEKTFDINVKGVFFTVQSLLPVLRDGASVVLTASIVANKGMANLSLYNASKAAVRSFARSFANDLKARGIRVNAVSPGATRTPIMENGLKMTEEHIEGFRTHLEATAPIGRMADPSEIAKAVAFLLSDEASYITASDLLVDGGFAQI